MRKPTKYQRWWMEEVAKDVLLEIDGEGWIRDGQNPHKINIRSIRIVLNRGWIKEVNLGSYYLTSAGRKALEG